MLRLVVASASKASDASNLAGPASQRSARSGSQVARVIPGTGGPSQLLSALSSPLPTVPGLDGHHPKAVIVVGGHLIDQVDLPGEVLAHCFLAPLAAFARGEHDIIRGARHLGRPRFERQAGTGPRL